MQPLQNKCPEIENYNIDNPNDGQNFRLTRSQEGSTPEEKTDALARKIVVDESAINNSAAEKITNAVPRVQTEDPIDRLERYCPGYRSDPYLALTKLDCYQWNNLVDNIGTLSLDLSDAITLCQRMNQCPCDNNNTLLEGNFGGLGFIEKIQECEDINPRLALSSKIAEAGVWAHRGLVKYFNRLGFVEAILACEDVNDRLALSSLIAAQGK